MTSLLSGIVKTKASRVLGIDCSTKSFAFCIFYNRRPVKWGKIMFEGNDIFERIADAAKKIAAISHEFDVDYVAMEGAILANNRNVDVTIKLSLMYGAVLSELLRNNSKVITVTPLEWQNYIGNKAFTAAQKKVMKEELPGKSASWYTDHFRKIRKQRTMDFFNKKWPHLELTDDDVGDSFGMAYFAYHKKTSR